MLYIVSIRVGLNPCVGTIRDQQVHMLHAEEEEGFNSWLVYVVWLVAACVARCMKGAGSA